MKRLTVIVGLVISGLVVVTALVSLVWAKPPPER